MTVKQLKAKLANVSDDAPVVRRSPDHSYVLAYDIGATTALHDKANGEWTEDHGEDITPESEYGKRMDVFVV